MNRICLPVALILAAAAALGGCDAGGDAARATSPAAVAAGGEPGTAGGGEHAEEDLLRLSEEERSRAGLKVEPLRARRLRDALEVTATIGPDRERIATVLPRLPGRIASVRAKLGDRVKRGQTLAVVESIEAAEAYAAHARALADVAVARAAFERAERLRAEQIVSEKEYQRARGEYRGAQAQLEAARGKLLQLGVTPPSDGSPPDTATFPVPAPLAGTVIERKAVLGELARTDQALFVVADLSRVWVEANIRESDLARVRTGATARARVSAYPDRTFEGSVGYVGAVLDRETRTVPAIVELDNPEGLLRPQMFATVSIDTGTTREVLAVPETAVTLVQGLPTVFVEESGGFEARPVELAGNIAGLSVVKSGVKPGERIVTEGTYALKARLLKSQIGDSH